ncbi:hypothetical protein HO133_000011 [Letharia lupina]|uniref:Uncharacterized protein n=1 Tax=Letharia lupina TaxID=560253 RepID=A0A8H6FLJ2_9LECA|nr:uncharacterized protein HO133_000011 [Letharia lupina]KAF6230752.1 hypothetical protein HO133_000011 [Letharia lupina]
MDVTDGKARKRSNQHTATSHCPQCGVGRNEFHKFHRPGQGLFSKHCSLCLGNDLTGKPRHFGECLICHKDVSQSSSEAVYKHYQEKHNQLLTQDRTIHHLHREVCPEDYPDLDFNQHYGLLLTRQNCFRDKINKPLTEYWRTFVGTPTLIYNELRDIRDHYREAFSNFFGADPITLHGHVSDAANPLLITSLIQHLNNNISPEDSEKSAYDAFKLRKEQTRSPNLAIMEGSYGTGFGPLAYNAPCPWSSTVACGTKPVVVRMGSGEIDQQVKRAKAKHCVALLVEIVRARDGCVMTAEQWEMTVQACRKHRMILIVDEAMTAIRCGAPFAHQLPEYERHGRPDFILFGKGIRTNGIAIDWKGVNVGILRKITAEEQVDVVVMWQKRFTEIAPPEILLQSWGIIALAQEQDWPQRSIRIGQTLRTILMSFGLKATSIWGLHSLIWLRRGESAVDDSAVMSANAGPHYTRWLPVMDTVMMSEEEMRNKVFGLGSLTHRRQVVEYFLNKGWWLGYCSRCGDTMETGEDREGVRDRCMVCFARPCEVCESGPHKCFAVGVERRG